MTTLLPAEWESQSQVMLTWPHARSDWAPILKSVTQLYETLSLTLADYVDVVIACDPLAYQHVKTFCENNAANCAYSLKVFEIESNDTWARDHGPISVLKDGEYHLLDFNFNAWGNKFSHEKDNRINATLYSLSAFSPRTMQQINFVLEGGAIESDGDGTLMTTEACMLNPNRNGLITKDACESQLKAFFGVHNIAWVNAGYLAGDDTDSHIDTLARFAPDNTIVYVKCSDPSDEHFESLNSMEQCLQQLKNANSKPYRLLPLPFPNAIFNHDGERLPATYANFLITNGAVLAPIYHVPQDERALDQLALAFPQHKIIPIDCRPLIEQHGSLHCITMQIAGVPHGPVHAANTP